MEDHADHVRPVRRVRLLVVEAREVGRLLLARDAPAGEEVHHDVMAAERGQRDGRARGEVGPGQRRCLSAQQPALHGGGLLRRPRGEDDAHHDEDEQDRSGHPPGGVAAGPLTQCP